MVAAAASGGPIALVFCFSGLDVLCDVQRGLFCSAAAAFVFVFGLVDLDSVNESDGEVGHNTASSLIAGIGDQATRGVDVPGGVPQPAAAASQVIRKDHGQNETELEVHQINCEFGENATFQVLVKQFGGQHLAVSVQGDWLVADLAHCLQLRSCASWLRPGVILIRARLFERRD